MSNHRQTKQSIKHGFTLVEMLIVAPIVILVIGVFVSAIVSMTGDVLVVRGKNALTYDVQDALNHIDQDVKLSGGYLAINNIALSTGQGYDGAKSTFKNYDATNGAMLILNTYATNKNPLDSTRSYIYAKDQLNACNSPQVTQNSKVMMNTIYFVKNNALWRRAIAPSSYTTVGCSVPWQQPTCAPGYVASFCKTQDTKLVDGVSTSDFTIDYYTSANNTTPIVGANDPDDSVRQAAIEIASSINITINATKTIAGRDITQSGTIRSLSSNKYVSKTTLPAPLNPVADWQATTQGDHYGNFYDSISKNYATVTRSGVKTIYDPATQKIYDIPANYLGVNSKSGGNEAVIEEGRTNYSTYSDFENTMVGWNYQTAGYGSAAPSMEKSVYGDYSLKISRTATGGEANVYKSISGLANSTTYYYSAWIWASTPSSGCISTAVGTTNLATTCHTGTADWQRVGGTFVSSATGTIQLRLGNWSGTAITNFYFDAAQVELGSFATSYIPTVAATVARNADVVTIPTVSAFNSGSVFAVMNKPLTSNRGIYIFGLSGNNFIGLYANTTTSIQEYSSLNGSLTYGGAKSGLSTYNVAAWRWGPSGANPSLNDSIGSWSTMPLPTGTPTTTYIGSFFGGTNNYGSPIQRIVIYSSALSDSDVSNVTNVIKSGP